MNDSCVDQTDGCIKMEGTFKLTIMCMFAQGTGRARLVVTVFKEGGYAYGTNTIHAYDAIAMALGTRGWG